MIFLIGVGLFLSGWLSGLIGLVIAALVVSVIDMLIEWLSFGWGLSPLVGVPLTICDIAILVLSIIIIV